MEAYPDTSIEEMLKRSGLAKMVTPQLTTVRQDVVYRASKAVEYLLKMKNDHEYSVTETVPVKLIIRDSSKIINNN